MQTLNTLIPYRRIRRYAAIVGEFTQRMDFTFSVIRGDQQDIQRGASVNSGPTKFSPGLRYRAFNHIREIATTFLFFHFWRVLCSHVSSLEEPRWPTMIMRNRIKIRKIKNRLLKTYKITNHKDTTPMRLKHNKDFIPCPVQTEDELFSNGVFVFNISRMIEDLQSKSAGIPISEFQFSECYCNSDSFNEAHIDSVNLDKPIILAEIAPNRYNVIDGNHRVEKAKRTGSSSLPCYRLQPIQHTKYLTTRKAYDTYVEYWNDKLG